MSLHIVTGYKGGAHITPKNIGAFNAGIVGSGEYILNTGEQLRAVVESNNLIKIYDGDIVIQGRHFTLEKGKVEEITINNGEVDKNRIDLIVIRYTKDSATGIENTEFAVLQGTATAGTATDPKYTTGDILSDDCLLHEVPLYRITLTGLNVGDPELLIRNAGSIEDALTMRGWNPLKSVAEDTPDKWRQLGNGIWFFDIANLLIGQPSQWGFLYNTVCLEEVSQEFVVQASGERYRRNANGAGWYGTNWRSGEWAAIYDSLNPAYVFGTYTGDESESKFINLGFTPKLVYVARSDGATYYIRSEGAYKDTYLYGGLAHADRACSYWDGGTDRPIIEIVENGFKVFYSATEGAYNSDDTYIRTNAAATYHYMAFK